MIGDERNMQDEECISVRVDFLKSGNYRPISFIDSEGKTHYIKEINLIEERFITTKETVKYFFCNTSSQKFILIFKNYKWYLSNFSD